MKSPSQVGTPAPACPLPLALRFACVALLLLGASSVAAGPLGPEVLVNSTVVDSQRTAEGSLRSRAAATNGNGYVIVWQSANQDGSGYGIYARRYGTTGAPVGNEFRVNDEGAGSQTLPSISMDTADNFVVVWQGAGPSDADGIYARLFDSNSAPRGPQFRVNQTTAGIQASPDVAMDNGGGFVVVWHGNGSGDSDGVFVRRYSATGSATTDEILVNMDTAGTQARPALSTDSNGDFVVVWEAEISPGDFDIYLQRFSGSANPQGAQTRVNATTRAQQLNPSVARKSNSDFAVVWESDDDTTAATDFNVYFQRFSSNGSPQGSEARVNSVTSQAQTQPFVEMASTGDFIIVWASDDDPTPQTDWNVWMQLVNKSGNPINDNAQVNTSTAGEQTAPSLAVDNFDNFTVVWSGNGAGDDAGVFARLWGDAPGSSADLGLAIVVDDPTPFEAASIVYTITLTNNGPDAASGVQVLDLLPAGVTFESDFATLGSYSPTTGIWDVGSIPASSNAVLVLTTRVDAGTAGTTISNVVSIAAASVPDPASANNAASVDVTPGRNTLGVSGLHPSVSTMLPGDAPRVVFELQLNNLAAVPETLRALTFANATSGPGTATQLDASWSEMTLEVAGTGVPLAKRSFAAQRATFDAVDLVIAPFDTLRLWLHGAPSLTARDSDLLDVRVESPSDLDLSGAVQAQATWPIDPDGGVLVDGMAAAQIRVHELNAGNFFTGTTRNLALDITLPANGYEADILEKINVVNLGTALFGDDIDVLEAWVDDGDGTFEADRDVLLGALVQTGNRWELTALSEAVSTQGLRLFVTVGISSSAVVGRTVRLGIGSDTDIALGMSSGNDGPIDRAVSNRFEQSISTNDRITLTHGSLPSGSVRPGERDLPLLHLVATNSYAVPRTMTHLTLTNAATTVNGGTQAQLDSELERVTLRFDGNGNGILDNPNIDPLVTTAFFSQGEASFDGFAWNLPAGMVSHLFVTADVSLQAAADGDLLGIRVEEGLDIVFDAPTALLASWPIDSGARWTVDGMVAAQVMNWGAPGATLGPGDSAPALDLLLPANAYASDLLQGITLQNLGTATGFDLSDMRLWRDGGDGVFNPRGGDDVELGPMVQVGATWKSPQIAAVVPPAGLRLFVEVTVASQPLESSSILLAVPVGGLVMASANDGPVDAAIVNAETLVLSSAPLLATLFLPPASTVGQAFQALMQVQNRSGETITDIRPSALSISGDGVASELWGPTPPSFDLAPGALASFTWTFSADAIGNVQMRASAEGTGATSGLTRRSLETSSNAHRILFPADTLHVQPVGSTPFSISRGESDVVPLSLTLTNASQPGASGTTSSVLLRELRLRVETDQGDELVPAELFSRLALREGGITYAETTALPTSDAEVLLTPPAPIEVTASEPVTLSLVCDILAATVHPVFRLAILDASWLTAEDGTSTQGVRVVLQPQPIRSGAGQIHAAPTQLDVRAQTSPDTRVGRGQSDVVLLRIEAENLGVDGLTSGIRLGGLELAITDDAGVAQTDPSRFFQGVRVKSGVSLFGETTIAANEDTTFTLPLSLPPVIAVNTSSQLTILGDVSAGSPTGRYRVRLSDASRFEARDETTNQPVPVVYANPPVQGATIAIEAPAESLRVRGTPEFPPRFTVGESGRRALVADVRHPGTAGVGRVHVRGITLKARDEARRALSLDAYIDRLRVLRAGQEIAVVTQLPVQGDLDVPITGLVLEAGEEASLLLEVDVEATAPISFLELLVPALDAIDANLGSTVVVTPESGAELPLTSGLTRLGSPATELVVGMESQMPATLVGDGREAPMARLELVNTAASGSGSIDVEHLVFRAADRDFGSIHLGAAASRLRIYLDGDVWGDSGAIAADSATVELRPAQVLSIAPGSAVRLDVVAVLRHPGVASGFRLGVDAADVGVVQPGGALLNVRVESAAGQEFPLWTEPGSFASRSLLGSFANFPNPFAAGRENTTFVYFLPTPARVDLRILTPRGETVATLLGNAPRAAGLHQVDTWRGRNGRGAVVYNGVYLAELVVTLEDGSRHRLLRRVAVVR
ncbi:MAG: DUF11 domain-containing protein [Candidatus Latescibacterota bacterium]|nr:MAG: DUF11 domain-containing protein [Candidatus Latescibacterota bacterium]